MSDKGVQDRSYPPQDSEDVEMDQHLLDQRTPSPLFNTYGRYHGPQMPLPTFVRPLPSFTYPTPQFTPIVRGVAPATSCYAPLIPPPAHHSNAQAQALAPTGDAAALAADYAARLAAVDGVVIPSALAPGQEPIKPSGVQSKDRGLRTKFCPICRTDYDRSADIRLHFVACVARNGNPSGLRWEAGSKRRSSKNDVASHRMIKMRDALAAVNGVVVPSKLGPGQAPHTRPSHARHGATLDLACPICGSLFGQKSHVREHFPKCVRRNGNPRGLTWDHGL